MDTSRLLTLKPKAPAKGPSAQSHAIALPMSAAGQLAMREPKLPTKPQKAQVSDEIADICAAMGIEHEPIGIVEVVSAPSICLEPDMVISERDRQWMLETAGDVEPPVERDLPPLEGIEFVGRSECHFCNYVEEAVSYTSEDESLVFCFECVERLTPIFMDLYDVMEAMANSR